VWSGTADHPGRFVADIRISSERTAGVAESRSDSDVDPRENAVRRCRIGVGRADRRVTAEDVAVGCCRRRCLRIMYGGAGR